MSDGGLEFAPLYFVWHDGWRWIESKTLLDYNDSGPVHVGRSMTCYQRGHCHLFFPDVDPKKSSGQMYWGRQEYNFNVVDEWGPNSSDPIQNKSVRLLGKPIWYFYIEEYWRRMYVQAWDSVDNTCKLPCNQTVEYDKMSNDAYWTMLIREFEEENHFDQSPDDYYLYQNYDEGGLPFEYYFRRRQYANAIDLYMALENVSSDYNAWLESHPGNSPLGYLNEDVTVLDPITGEETVQERMRMGRFLKWYDENAVDNSGYADHSEALRDYIDLHGIRDKQGSKYGADGNVYVPREETVGHIGIKYDASKPCHSLGPFREGGEFYFFNTVVNRTLPVEYWLDEERRTRQHYLKMAAEGVDTKGGQTWTFAGDKSHFIWIYDSFSEARALLGDLYEMPDGSRPSDDEDGENNDEPFPVVQMDGNDYYTIGAPTYPETYYNHRVPLLYGLNDIDGVHHVINGFNAKRLRTDQHEYSINEIPGSDATTPVQNHWYGDNSKVVPSPYDEDANISALRESDLAAAEERAQQGSGHYEEDGWHEDPPESVQDLPERGESSNAVHWERRQWTGWFEEGETVMSALDGKWYRRVWKPARYDRDRFGDDVIETVEGASWNPVGEAARQPYWTREKRQWFPNPPPHLCDDSRDGEEVERDSSSSSSSSSSKDIGGDFARSDPWDTVGDNRLHRLYWEYAYYFGLVRTYDDHGNYARKCRMTISYDDDSYVGVAEFPEGDYKEEEKNGAQTIRYEYDSNTGSYASGDWETMMEEWFKVFGEFASPEDEAMCFQTWVASLGELVTKYQDKSMYYDGEGKVIDEKRIDIETNSYMLHDSGPGYEAEWAPLPPPVYTVNYGGNLWGPMIGNNPITYVTFEEFCNVWRPLTADEIDRMNLNGDYPVRNDVPYPVPESLDEYISGGSSSSSSSGEPSQLELDNIEFKTKVFKGWTEESLLGEAAPTVIKSAFFPRLDFDTRAENAKRSEEKPPRPELPLSPLDEEALLPKDGSPVDPYRNGSVDPIEEWKKYFSHREEFTIPMSTVAGGDRSIENPKTTPNLPTPHPRETSYSREDGARRHYPDDMFVTPVIEYQKIIRTNATVTEDGYCRLPGKEQDDAFIQANWKTARNPTWGDGFDVTVSIPYKIGGEVQSPFSDAGKNVKPAGEYCHDCVKEECKMRYHIDWYDSLEKIRRFDFPNYVDIMRDFQDECVSGQTRLYVEDFNDHEKMVKYRATELKYTDGVPNLPELVEYNVLRDGRGQAPVQKWQDALDEYWTRINGVSHFSDRPIVRGYDCYGNETTENAFTTLKDGSSMWREQTTNLLPTIDKVEYTEINGERRPGYLDSKGNLVKGGKVVEFNNPFGDGLVDGKWVEQCLGAVVKAKCLLILEDGLGYRWKQWVDATAMQPSGKIKGKDYDG